MSATVFDTPLDARSLIEASAGTGKTHALAGLFARAVIVGRLRVPQILAVTYTTAATQELHERVRKRLQAAAELAHAWCADTQAEFADDNAEIALLRRLLHAALHDGSSESLAALRMRLARAAREMDMAAITTIHGFCQRLLAEHALDAGQALLAAEIVPDNAAHRSALALDLWRSLSGDEAGSDFLRRHFGAPGNLAAVMRDLLAPDPLLPPAPAGDTRARRHHAWIALARMFQCEGEHVRATLQGLIAKGLLSRDKKKTIPIDALWTWFAEQGEAPPLRAHPQLARLARDYLQALCLKDSSAPDLPLCEAVERFLEADDASALQRLHALRLAARQHDGADKRATRSRDYDDLITAVFDATGDAAVAPHLAASLRGQFPLVLVDEFQDTDARQWAIFSRLFGEGGLLLVGDPKQAIYSFRGGDVETYLAARTTARIAAPLRHNYRSRPCLVAAVNALFSQPSAAHALGAGIAFVRNEAGRDAGCDAHLLVDGLPAAPLRFHQVPARLDQGKANAWNKDESIRIAARLCADAIRDLLQRARSGDAQRIDGGGRRLALQPRDCAVLVRVHDEGAAVREELARRGIPAVSAGRDSLFATPQAQSLLALLLALANPGDDRRLRAALASPLFGLDASALRALKDDGNALSRWQQAFAQWRQRWEQHGPQALLTDVVAGQAPRLLALADGEHELTYLLQLGELMQQVRARRLGPQSQIDWLRAAIADADGNDEAQQPRLESDAGRVQILTLHASKGLEFPLVFLPFAGIGRGNGNAGKTGFVAYHDDSGQRVRQWNTGTTQPGALPWKEASERAKREARAEDMRLLYVGATRARDALWLCGGALAASDNTALCQLLGGPAPSRALRTALDGLLQWEEGLSTGVGERLAAQPPPDVPAPRTPRRRLQRDWWIHSFSSLHRQRAQATRVPAEEAPAEDERPLAGLAGRVRFGGTRFGNALHQALEHVDFARWRDAEGAAIADDDLAILKQALIDQGYARADLDDGARELALLVARTLNAPLGVDTDADVRLCDVAAAERIAELEFHFTLAGTDTSALLGLLRAHDIAPDRIGFGSARLDGLMNGKIDLTCCIDGRLYVLDYKSNRLSDYGPQALRRAMRASEYDLQALLYVVAVHRWMRSRRGDAYDYARDVGGVRYLFCRGLEPSQPGQGVVRLDFPRVLIEAADRLFAADGDRT